MRLIRADAAPANPMMSKKENAPTSQPLKGIRILVGRARHQAGALSAQLRERGAKVLEIPFIEIRKPRSFQALDRALKNLHTYDWLILTSVNGVEAMWDRAHRLSLKLPWNGSAAPSIAAIGPATKKAIEQRGIRVNVVPKEYVAESVVRSMKSKVKGKRVLLVRAKVARDVIPRELQKAGAHIEVVEAYETVVPKRSRQKLQTALWSATARPHVITFTSSSTVKNFVALRGRGRPNLNGIRIASIGPVTSATLEECGFKVAIAAREYTIPGLVEAIAGSFRRQPLEP